MFSIFSQAAMPFMAMWKKEPRSRMGRKKSAERRRIIRHPKRDTVPSLSCNSPSTAPRAAPP
jgi:hypothetical protein